LAHLEELFKRLHEVNMKIHPKKCKFVVTSIIYLGHRIEINCKEVVKVYVDGGRGVTTVSI